MAALPLQPPSLQNLTYLNHRIGKLLSISNLSNTLNSLSSFLRSEDEDDKRLTWDDKLAKKYYNSLYREFGVCDLKHYKTGQVSGIRQMLLNLHC